MVVEETGEPFFRLPAEGGLALEFEASFPYGPDDPDIIGLLIRVSGAFVQVEHPVVLSRHDGPSGFLHLLYEDFRGWTGARTWSSLENELQLSAVHEGTSCACSADDPPLVRPTSMVFLSEHRARPW